MLEPSYDFRRLPEPVVLEQGHAEVEFSDSRILCNADIRLRGLPKPGVEVLAYLEGVSEAQRTAVALGAIARSLSFNGLDVPGFQLSVESSDEGTLLRWCPGRLPLETSSRNDIQLSRIVFHLFDFFPLHRLRDGRLEMRDGEWVVTLHQENEVDGIDRASRADGVCRLTHVGEIERADGSLFSVEDASEQLAILRYFMTFARGTWCDPVCTVGFGAYGSKAWQSFSSPQPGNRAISSWFDYVHPEQLSELFPLFARRWRSSEAWRDCLREVIYWYVNANTPGGVPGIDVSILLSQAALERLSYQFSVVDQRIISSDGFKRSQMRASDKLRLLLSSVGIPIDIPTSCISIRNSGRSWTDGPHAFSDIRNALVHPDASGRSERFRCIKEGWKLGLWYLELALLAVCDYRQTYGNRLTRQSYGQVEPVPWARRIEPSLVGSDD